MNPEIHHFTVDQRRVSLKVYRAEQSDKTLIIGPAMGAKSSFYQAIASHFYERDFNCVLFDYHGMFHQKGVTETGGIAAFGKTDLQFVIDYSANVLRTENLYFLGHSISGQVLPLAGSSHAFKAAYLVAAQSVDMTNWSGASRLAVNLFWNVFIPVTTSLFNYLPFWAYGGKYHLSSSIARDWARLARKKGGIAADTSENASLYRSFNVPTKFISIEGDNLLAPETAVIQLYHQYASTGKELQHLSTDSAKTLNHFSFFRKQNRHLWDDIFLWFERAHAGRHTSNIKVG